MTTGMGSLLRRGACDSVLQVAATSLVRFGLALAVLALAPFVSLVELGHFDLFIVGSSFALLGATLGMDSGLAIVTSRHTAAGRRAVLLAALATMMAVALAGTAGLATILLLHAETEGAAWGLAVATFAYGVLNAGLILIFSWFRWQGRAVTASLLLILAQLAGFLCSAMLFAWLRTILGFVSGLICGAAIGVLACMIHLVRAEGLTRRDLRFIRMRWRLWRVVRALLAMSLPYVAASVSLLLRRVVDRSYLLALGDPALLGAYAIVVRIAELVGFAFSLPATGLAPIFIAHHRDAQTLKLARAAYVGYVCTSAIAVLAVVLAVPLLPVSRAQDMAGSMLGLLAPLLAGTLFLGELSIAGFGYIIARSSSTYTVLSALFILLYALALIVLFISGLGAAAIAISFALSAFLYSTAAIAKSESLASYGYRVVPLTLVKLAALVLSVASMCSWN